MNKNENIVARKIHDSFFLINIKDDYSDETCNLYEINEIGYFLWNKVSECNTIAELVDELSSALEDEVDKSILTDDVNEYISGLVEMGFIFV